MKKWVALVLAFVMIFGLAACGSPSKPKIEENKGENAETYPYVVHMRSATWYLAADDIALLGEDAFYPACGCVWARQKMGAAEQVRQTVAQA